MPKITGNYEPSQTEPKWVDVWEREQLGVANARDARNAGLDGRFVMVMPPPNVTGTLHLGHTMMSAVEDTLSRWNRMKGKVTCWLPGLDHAGIATQSVLERHLARYENVSKHDLGREKFIERVMQWKEEKGGRILFQLRRLGCSCDWSREAFTMSAAMSEAVVEAFCRLHEKGLVYRDLRLVAWCPHLNTALSEIETETLEFEKPERIRVPGYEGTVEVGMLWVFKYELKQRPGEYITVATTRLETMLGDVAVAVNPKDERYKEMIGCHLIHPFDSNRNMRLIGDEHCDPEFGTGAVKITPAHDRNDYEVGLRHNLEAINVLTKEGKINEMGGKFAGMNRFAARIAIEKELEEMGLFVEKRKNTKKMALPICSRSGDIIEYMLVPQWYIKCEDMAKRAAEACRCQDLTILPSGSDKQWYHWLDNTRDWCVSRQLWWGHRIPAYLVKSKRTGERICDPNTGADDWWIVARSEQEALKTAMEKLGGDGDDLTMSQDEDVLDTWFSSGLFPMAVFGWPHTDREDYQSFFPTTLLETGSDILFFWVARMVMLSLELCDTVPFKTVFLHPMVRDSHGKKMSKSLGNVVDPLDVIKGIPLETLIEGVQESNLKASEIKRAADALKKDFPRGIEECGADALRYGLLAYLKGGRGVNLDINRVVAYRHFCNKIWNATKFAMTYFEAANYDFRTEPIKPQTWADQWIMHRCQLTTILTDEGLSKYDFDAAVSATYSFWLYDFCDIYLELIKPRLADIINNRADDITTDQKCALSTLYQVLDYSLKTLHPLMPFLTEELWQHLKTSSSSYLMNASYPRFDRNPEDDDRLDKQMSLLMECVQHFRSMLSQFDVQPNKIRLRAYLITKSPDDTQFLSEHHHEIATLAKLEAVTISTDIDDQATLVHNVVNDRIKSALDPAGVIDFGKVIVKLRKRQDQIESMLSKLEAKINLPDYQNKVPDDIQAKNTENLNSLTSELASLREAINGALSIERKGT